MIVNGSIQVARLTTAQIAASSTVPLAGQLVFNSQTGQYKVGDGTTALSALTYYGGSSTTINGTGFVKASGTTISYDNTTYTPLSGAVFGTTFTATQFNPADAATYYIGNTGYMPNVNAPNGIITLPFNCTLVAWNINIVCNAVAGSNESATFNIRLNQTSDVLLSNAITYSSGTGFNTFSATGLSTNFSANDSINIKLTTPTWATNPTQTYHGITLWFVRR